MAASPSVRLWPALLVFVGMAAVGVSVVGCKQDKTDTPPVDTSDDDPTLLAEDGTDSANAETDSEVVTSSLVSASTAAGGSLGVGDGAKAIYFPKGCLTVTSDTAAKQVTYAFDNCAGPNGILRIKGTLVATYALTPGKLVLDMVATDLQVNRALIDWSAHAEVTASGAARTMTWHATLTGTTARGRDLARTDDKTITWSFGDKCFAVAGVSTGMVKDRFVMTEIADYRRCAGACPETGGRITITNDKAKVKVEILFDGTGEATYSTPKGTTSFDLACKS